MSSIGGWVERKRQLFRVNHLELCLRENIPVFHQREKQRVISITFGANTRFSTHKAIVLHTRKKLPFVQLRPTIARGLGLFSSFSQNKPMNSVVEYLLF